jgi:hypothetical protein
MSRSISAVRCRRSAVAWDWRFGRQHDDLVQKTEFVGGLIVTAFQFFTGVTVPTFMRHLPALDVFLRQIWRAF